MGSLPPSGFEVLVGFNGADPSHGAFLHGDAIRHPSLKFVELERAGRGGARNRLVALARGRIAYFLDDDTAVPDDFASLALATFQRHPGVPAAGGPNLGMPGATAFQRAVDGLLGSPLGAGPMRVRFRALGEERLLPGWCFTLSNLGVRREVFLEHGLSFPESCASAEENFLLSRVERRIGPALYNPALLVYHRRRDTLGGYCRQSFLCGQGRSEVTRLDPRSLQPIVLAPLALLLYVLALPLLDAGLPRLVPGLLYAAACAAESARLALRERDPRAAAWLPIVAASGHLSYAAGLLRGLLPAAHASPETPPGRSGSALDPVWGRPSP